MLENKYLNLLLILSCFLRVCACVKNIVCEMMSLLHAKKLFSFSSCQAFKIWWLIFGRFVKMRWQYITQRNNVVQNKLPGNDGNQPHYLDFQAETLKRRKGYIQRGGAGGGGTAIYGLYRYVPLWRVWFSSSLLLDRVYKSERLGLE